MFTLESADYFENFDLDSIVTPVNICNFEKLLSQMNYDKHKTEELVNSFRNGFELGYEGPQDIQRRAPNLKLRVGNETILWNKVMKEVKKKCYAGPFSEVPFKQFVQSPIGLVTKDSGRDTRLIFHLSYPKQGLSINSCTPKHKCTVKYPDFNDAVRLCWEEFQRFPDISQVFIGKSDFTSAFHNLGMKKSDFKFLVMKALSPIDGKIYFS